MKKILLDTNMLLAPLQTKAQIYAERAQFFTTSRCIEELEIFAHKTGTKLGGQAKAALQLAKEKHVTVLPVQGKTDDALMRVAREHGLSVATNDQELLAKLMRERIPAMRLRQKKFVIED